MKNYLTRELPYVAILMVVATAASAGQGQSPSSPLEFISAWLQQIFGPIGSYVSYAVTTYVGAVIWVVKMRKSLESEWTSLTNWKDDIVVVCAPMDTTKPDVIYHTTFGNLRIYRGRVLLTSSDDNEPILSSNRMLIRIARLGDQYIARTRLLYSPIMCVTMAVCQTVVLLVLLVWDGPKFSPDYVPVYQPILGIIFLWPIALSLFEHERVPRWKTDLSEAKRQVELISRDRAFAEGRIV